MRYYTPKQNYRGMDRERAEKIRELYFQKTATQKELAERFGVSQSTISKIISDQVWETKQNASLGRVKYKYVDPLALPPVYATKGSACFDLHSCTAIDIPARHKGLIRTGLAFELPEGHVMLVFSRSGHAAKHSIRLSNCVGVIDSDYRGEVCVLLHNDSDTPFTVHHQDRIAQAMILPVPEVRLELGELSDTERGAGGFGSTG